MHIEQLESRRLYSVTTPITEGFGMVAHADQSRVVSPSSLGLLNSNMIGTYTGEYKAGLISSGNAEMDITGQTVRSFSGELTLTSDDGTNLSGSFKATLGKTLKYSFAFKSGKTAIKVSGILNLGYNGVAGTFTGHFQGQAVRRGEGTLVVYNFAGIEL